YDMAWRRGILEKLYSLGFRGNLPIFIANLLSDRTFRVRMGSTFSDLFCQENGVPQGSVLSPTLFMLLINDILSASSTHIKYTLYADDIVIWSDAQDLDVAKTEIQKTLDELGRWQDLWGTTFSAEKSNFMVFTKKRTLSAVHLRIKGVAIPETDSTFFLGLKFDCKLRWDKHIQYLFDSCSKRLNVLRSIQSHAWGADRSSILLVYKSFIRAKFDYGCHIYDAAAPTIKKKLNTIQNTALRLATGALRNTTIKKLEVEANVLPLQLHRDYLSLAYGSKILSDPLHPTRVSLLDHHDLRHSSDRPFARRLHDLSQQYNVPLLSLDNRCSFELPPWIQPSFHIDLSVHSSVKAVTPVEVLRARGRELISQFQNTDQYFTDGSVQGDLTGVGVFHRTFNVCQRLPNHTSIYTAEAYAIFLALRRGLKEKRDFTVFSDSYSCLSAVKAARSDHPVVARILNILHHSSLVIWLCWIPSHCGILGNEQADRLAGRALHTNAIADIRLPRQDFLRQVRVSIARSWQEDYDSYTFNRYKYKVGFWETSCHENRLYEVCLARLRLNCVKFIHLVPHIENTHPLRCPCDDSRMSLHHVFFNCGYYVFERLKLLDALRLQNLGHEVKYPLSDDVNFQSLVIDFLKNTNLLNIL
ncbi:unnamed protein product, partial [Meganyctiphanes norvegica]